MNGPKISVVIPYRARLVNLRMVLAALAEQTLDASEFEVVVGVLEYCPDYILLCREFGDRLRIVSVALGGPWNTSQARNLALRQVSGQVVILLDADMLLPPNALENVWARYFADGSTVCVLGRSIGYQTRTDADAGPTEPYAYYRGILADEGHPGRVGTDARWDADALPMPWSVCWSGLVAISAAAISADDLYFDERFHGWGDEDVEWGYRVHRAAIPIVRGEDFYALHLPHRRDVQANMAALGANQKRFLAKWPDIEVEVYCTFGWAEGNRELAGIRGEVVAAAGGGRILGALRGPARGGDLLVLGVAVDPVTAEPDAAARAMFEPGLQVEVLPLVGFALPYPDRAVARCEVLEPIERLAPRLRDRVLAEGARVAAGRVAVLEH